MNAFEFSLLEQGLMGLMVFCFMFGIGTSLDAKQFSESLSKPRAFAIGLALQYLLMPLFAIGISYIFSLDPLLRLVLLIVACCPGGALSNLVAFLSRANVSLSISLTLGSSLLSVFMTPLLLSVYGAFGAFGDIVMPTKNIIFTLSAFLLPVAIGMIVRVRAPKKAHRIETLVLRLGVFVLGGMILLWVPKLYQFFLDNFGHLMLSTSLISFCGTFFAYAGSRLLNLSAKDSRAVSLETGIQNAPLAFALIGLSFASSDPIHQYAWVALLYGASSVGIAFLFTLIFIRIKVVPPLDK